MQMRVARFDGPSPMIGPARLIRAAFESADMAALAKEILTHSDDDVIEPGAGMDVATILLLMHRSGEALQLQAEILRGARHFTLRSNPPAARIRVLIIVTTGDLMANTPVDFLLDNETFGTAYLFVLPGEDIPRDLPDHDVLITGVAYSTVAEPLLEALAAAADHWTRPILNHPRHVLKTSRHGIAAALRDGEGLLVPKVVRVGRSTCCTTDSGLPDGLQFPVLVRPLDTHAGNDLQKVDQESDLRRYLDDTRTEDLYITQFCDYRSPDGLYRKLRVVLIDGVPFLCHMAVRDHWMIHYLNAGMMEDAEKRAAEADAMAAFDDGFAQRHRAAFAEIHRRIGLDYLIIDCAESTDGRLLIFEADTGMVVHDMDPVDLFPYKIPAMRRVYSAFQQAVARRV